MQQLTIIDTFGFFFRSFYALPPLQNSKGFPTGLLMGFANLIMKLYNENTHSFIVFALEGEGINRRKIIYPKYKANRAKAPQDLILQLPIAIEWIEKMGLVSIKFDGYEADDAIASLATKAQENSIKSRIISHDKDLYQLINENIFLYDPIKNIEIHEQECFNKFGVMPKNFIDYQSLVGDISDNIPGIKGIGSKSASKLISHFGSLDAIYANTNALQEIIGSKLADSVISSKNDAYLSRDLVTLKADLPIKFDLKNFAMPKINPLEKILDELDKYEFIKIIQRLTKQPMNTKYEGINKPAQKGLGGLKPLDSTSDFSFTTTTLDSLDSIKRVLCDVPLDSIISYDCETTGLDALDAKIVGFSFCINGKDGYYVPINHNYLGMLNQLSQNEAIEAIRMIFAHPIIGHNIKYDLVIAKKLGITPKQEIYDSMILAWLYDSVSKVGLDWQMQKWFSHTMIKFSDIVGKDENFSSVNIDVATQYAAEDAIACMALFKRLQNELESKDINLLELAKNLEFPFINVLIEMEGNGIAINPEHFENLSKKFGTELANLEKEIFDLVGSVFNINSPKQLGTILFDTLGLKAQRQIKGGYSTDEKTLLALIDSHPIIQKIMDYREVAKLKNTYVEPILKLHKNKRIHSSFLQTGTATGRLSSKSPNIQNIPVRTKMGKEIRGGFVASCEDNILLSIDYSQIELRLLAHFSQDPALIEAFKNNLDIHAQTAKIIFKNNEIAAQKRDVAKSINFGLIYGMGAKKLAQTLKIPFGEAKTYIQNYFESFPTVKEFLKSKEDEILSNGYSQTLLGHRRYFDFSNATEFMKANYLREGINSIFQGSAADLIKLAMLKIYKEFQNTQVKMLLQVHDELIFELPKDGAKEVAQKIAHIMNTIYELKVPLDSNISMGQTWADLK